VKIFQERHLAEENVNVKPQIKQDLYVQYLAIKPLLPPGGEVEPHKNVIESISWKWKKNKDFARYCTLYTCVIYFLSILSF